MGNPQPAVRFTTDAVDRRDLHIDGMVAREVEQAATELRHFRVGAWEHFGLAAVAFGLALAASQFAPAFGVPLLIGGIVSLALGVRDEVRRWDLIDRVVLDEDAYLIPAVRNRARQAATMKSRHALASSIRILLTRSDVPATRFEAVVEELEVLADELDDEKLLLDPAAAVACCRLIGDVESPLRNPAVPAEDAHARIVRILAGFRAKR